ncbi:hypothetical protein WA538_003414, partial [Blastocystis sp. DL]
LDFDSIPRAHPLRQSGTSRIQVDRSQNVKVSVRSHSTKSSRRSKKTNSKQAKIQPKTQSVVSAKQPQPTKLSQKQNRSTPKVNMDSILKRIGLASASLTKGKKSRSGRRRRNRTKKDTKKPEQSQTNNPYFNQVEYSEQR